MADMLYLKENLQGFVPTPTASEIIADVVRGSSVMRLSTVREMKSETHKTGLKDRPVERTPPRPKAIQRVQDFLDASKKAYGDYQHWRGMANANGIKNLAMKELRGALGKLKLK
ncbi:hypothetical protein [Selenomonas dianae]|uniref:Uncharacterized protein n=1 Tax=Selenomonas dianae TaxID=135079 RepID=A0ABN0TC69_9FIRM|nr:hypothetical protein [Selenomonas dianae]WLD82614.1 hypothetical protein QU667_01100 [Selenomonas dianae]